LLFYALKLFGAFACFLKKTVFDVFHSYNFISVNEYFG
jgi:hypothetical protein